jgi:hypothetical protein
MIYPEFFLTNARAGFASFGHMRKMAAVLIPGLERSRERIEISKGEMV